MSAEEWALRWKAAAKRRFVPPDLPTTCDWCGKRDKEWKWGTTGYQLHAECLDAASRHAVNTRGAPNENADKED